MTGLQRPKVASVKTVLVMNKCGGPPMVLLVEREETRPLTTAALSLC